MKVLECFILASTLSMFSCYFVIEISKNLISSFKESTNKDNYGSSLMVKENIKNYRNVQYYGNIYVGSMKEKHTVIFDTGSNILWLPAKDCIGCKSNTNTYNFSSSSTYKSFNSSNNITYAIGYVEGIESEDFVGLSPGLKKVDAVKLNFLLVTEERDLNTLSDGVMGLGVNLEGSVQNSFVMSLYTNNIITKPKFTVFLDNEDNRSRIYFGELENEKALILFENKCNIPNQIPYWACAAMKVSSDDYPLSYFEPDYKLIVFDTGTSYLIIPITDVLKIIKLFQSKQDRTDCALTTNNQLICKCQSPPEFPDLYIDFGNNSRVNIPILSLIHYNEELSYQCVFEILASDGKELGVWILGDSILRNLIVEFDLENKQLSFNNKTYVKPSIKLHYYIFGAFYLIAALIGMILMGRQIYRAYMLGKDD